MRTTLIMVAALIASMGVRADPAGLQYVDLRDDRALQSLKESNWKHYEQIQKILMALFEEPQRVEAGWLEATFNARDVDLQKLVFKTSHPPKQVLQFTLDDTRYTLDLVRTDLGADYAPAK
jgi:hypothetical protein